MLRVALPVPLRRLFDYRPPPGVATPLPGSRLQVPFGSRQLLGIVVESAMGSEVPAAKLRAAIGVLDTEPVFDAVLLALCLRVARYYQCPPGMALHTALPAALRRPLVKRVAHYRLSAAGTDDRHPRRADLRAVLGQGAGLSASALAAQGISPSRLRTARRAGWVESAPAALLPLPSPVVPPSLGIGDERPLRLRAEQRQAVTAVGEAFGDFQSFLLHGVAGSGKTEVYLHLIAAALERGLQALVLVPEIGLAPQLLQRIRRRFKVPIALSHSGLRSRQRLDCWAAARSGEAAIVVGTRSAVFTPLARLGLIVVDEEHDPSFKQHTGLLYSGRDVAVMRAQQQQVPVLLGSATPSLESLRNSGLRRYRLLRLEQRANARPPPVPQLIDLSAHQELRGGLSQPLIEAVGDVLDADHQVLLFLNRRGYAPTLCCQHCGWRAECPDCDARLVLHGGQPGLCCHHCGRRELPPERCPGCGVGPLRPSGYGTQRNERALRGLFPGVPIYRIDRDATGESGQEKLLGAIPPSGACILLGTQMLAKGHHFPAVTLAAVLDADSGLFNPNYRSIERLGQLLVQVAGRAGRQQHSGAVLVQTMHPGHPLFQTLFKQGYSAFAEHLLADSEARGRPPAMHMALLRAAAPTAEVATAFLRSARQLAEGGGCRLLGPLPAMPARRAGRHHYFLSLESSRREPLQSLLTELCQQLERKRRPAGLRWIADVDPEGIEAGGVEDLG